MVEYWGGVVDGDDLVVECGEFVVQLIDARFEVEY